MSPIGANRATRSGDRKRQGHTASMRARAPSGPRTRRTSEKRVDRVATLGIRGKSQSGLHPDARRVALVPIERHRFAGARHNHRRPKSHGNLLPGHGCAPRDE